MPQCIVANPNLTVGKSLAYVFDLSLSDSAGKSEIIEEVSKPVRWRSEAYALSKLIFTENIALFRLFFT